MNRVLLNSTQAGARAGLSAEAFNKLLYKKGVLNKRGRRSRKNPQIFKPYWFLLNLNYGKNIPTSHGGNNVRFYEDRLPALLEEVGLRGLV